MTRFITLAVFALLLFLPSGAFAQTTSGSIAGVTKDSSGAVIPGVTVEASSPALIEKTRTAVTDALGQYKIVDLRPGTYAVTFSLTGFTTIKREGIIITEGFTAPVNAELAVGNVAETLTVAAASPVVDVQGTTQAMVVSRDALTAIPTAEYLAMVGNLIPGVQGAGSGGTQDVGGNTGWGSVRMAIHGGVPQDQDVMLDGFTVMRAGGDGTTNTAPIEGSIQGNTMEVSGHAAEFSSGGMRVNIVPRNGGNRYSGGVYGNFTNRSLESDNLNPTLEALGLKTTTTIKSLWGFSPSLGGPIKQDALWFYIAGGINRDDQYVASDWENNNINGWTYVADLSRPAVQDQNTFGVNGRLTYQYNAKNRFNFFGEKSYVCGCHLALTGTTAPEASTRAQLPTRTYQVNWTSPLTNRLLLQAGWGHIETHNYTFGNEVPHSDHPIRDTGTGLSYSAKATAFTYHPVIDDFKASATYVTGSHAVKVGLQYQLVGYNDNDTYPVNGAASYVLVNGKANSVTYLPGSVYSSEYAHPLGLYAQDRWTIKRLTLDAGLRFDALRTSYPNQTEPVDTYRPTAVSFPAADVLSWQDLDPRIGVAYDLFGNGKTALKANVSRYVKYESVVLTTAVNPANASQAGTTRSWTDNGANGGIAGDFIVQGNPLIPAVNGELGASSNKTFGQPAAITTTIDPNYAKGFETRPYQWEFSAGIQQQVFPGVAVSATYFRRTFGNTQVTQNTALNTPSMYSTYCVTAPADSRLPNGGGYPICGLYDLNAAFVGGLNNVITTDSLLGGHSLQHWNGADFLVNGRVHGIILQGGLSTGKTMTDNCDLVAQLGNPSQLYCHTETPFLNSFRMSGAYPLKWDTQVAAALQSNAGPVISGAGTFTNAQTTLGHPFGTGTTTSVQLVEPGTLYNGRSNQLDVRFTKYLKVQNMRYSFDVDLYNITNSTPVLSQNNTYGTNGATWLQPTAVLAPRLLKFGIRMDF